MCDTPRLFLPFETLDKLVCMDCKQYLRCGPIKVNLDGESVCGKCASSSKHAEPLIRHKAFEEVIRLVCFPCKYRKLGCPQYVNFNDTTNHEDLCAFRTYYCPVDFLTCTWSGTSSQLPQHYGETHSNLLINATTFELYLDENIQETKLYMQDNLSFLIKFKVSKEEGKFFIKIEHLGDGNLMPSITYKLILHTTEEDGLRMVMKERLVSCGFPSSVFDVKDSHCVDINSLLTILENPSNVFCTVDLKIPTELLKEIRSKLEELKCPHCSVYMSPPIFICSEGHTSCEDCTGYNKKCRVCNKECMTFSRHTMLEVSSASRQLPCRWPSCEEILNYSTIRNHEKTCQRKKYKCPRCYKWHGTEKKLCEHFSKEHETHPLHLSKTITISGETKVYDFYVLAFGDIFGCSLFPTSENGTNFSVWYYGLPTFYDNYKYYVHMADKSDGKSEVFETYKLAKCCATENCFSFNLKIPNEDMEKYSESSDVLQLIFEIVEKP